MDFNAPPTFESLSLLREMINHVETPDEMDAIMDYLMMHMDTIDNIADENTLQMIASAIRTSAARLGVTLNTTEGGK